MDIPALKTATSEHLEAHTALDRDAAEALVEALCLAAQAELLAMVSGGMPYPTSMSDQRALRLRYICEAAERLLTTEEVSVLFHTTLGVADGLLTRMESLYPTAIAPHLAALVTSNGHWKEAGQAGDLRYLIDFDQAGAWQHAATLLRQAGWTDLRPRRTQLTLEPPRTATWGGTKRDVIAVLALLPTNKRP